MELFNRKNQNILSNTEPTRSSIFLLIAKLAFIIILFDILYSLIFYILTIFINLPLEWHHHISVGMLFLVLAKNIIEVGFVTYAVMSWMNTVYSIENGHLVIKKGIMHTVEDVYELKTIRSIEVDQTFLGKLFHFGNVILKTSASGGYQVVVSLIGITDPYKYEKRLDKYF